MGQQRVDFDQLRKIATQVVNKGADANIYVSPITFQEWLVWVLVVFVFTGFIGTWTTAYNTGLTTFGVWGSQYVYLVGGFALGVAFLCGLGLWRVTLGKPALEIKVPKKENQVTTLKPEPPIVNLPVEPVLIDDPTPTKRSLVGVDNNPYLLTGATKLTLDITDENDDFPLYNINDFQFKLEYAPSGLIYGTTGGGKTVLVYNLLKLLAEQYQPKFVIADFAGMDWPESEFKTTESILELFEWLQIINRGRQLDGTMGRRIVVLLEEMQMFLMTLQLKDKKNKTKTFEEFTLTASQISITSRKTGACHLFGVMQNPKASVVDTTLRSNLPVKFGLKADKNLAGKIMECPSNIAPKMNFLQPGFTYSHLLDSFFEYPKVDRPTNLDRMTRQELYLLQKSYVRKYGDKVLIVDPNTE